MTASAPSSLDVVRAFVTAIEQKDYQTAMTHMSADCEYDNVPMPELKVFGPEGMRGLLEPFFASTLENDFVILHEVEDGPVVFMERLDRHRVAHGWVELPVTGVWEVHDGLITLWRDYFDAATIEQMLNPPA